MNESRARGRHLPRSLAAALLLSGAAFASASAGCGDSLGADCEQDSECDVGQACASPGCVSEQLVCLIPCGSDDECATNAGAGSICTQDPLGA